MHFDDHAVPLLVFMDCLVLPQTLQIWGRSDFWPDPRDIIHFDIPSPSGTPLMVRTIETGQGQESAWLSTQ